jgi:thioredoxin 1
LKKNQLAVQILYRLLDCGMPLHQHTFMRTLSTLNQNHMKLSFRPLFLILPVILILASCSSKNNENNPNILTLNEDNFNSEISSGVILVDFWATWCMPCKAMAPVLSEIASQTKGKIRVGKVDIDQNPGLASRYNVQGIPNFIIFKDGQMVENIVGMQSKEALIEALERHIKLQ